MQVKTSSIAHYILELERDYTEKKNVDEIYIRVVKASIANAKVVKVLWDRSQHPLAQWI